MATKQNPGKYDCYSKAAPDEPLFTLRGKDPIAPYLVSIWALTRQGAFIEAIALLVDAAKDHNVRAREFPSNSNKDKLIEAFTCAQDMQNWYASLHKTVAMNCPKTQGQAHCRLDTNHEGACDFA